MDHAVESAGVFPGDRPILMAIVGAGGALSASRAVEGGADLVQVRAKHLSSRALERLVREVISGARPSARVLVNSRPDIAELADAWGVHLPEAGLDPKSVRRAFPRLVIGVSRHDRAGLERAIDEGADYALLGPVFDSPLKEGRALGLDRLREMLRGLAIPVLAVGGVTPGNAALVLDHGARGIAAIRPFEDEEASGHQAMRFRVSVDRRP
jgi:thiamine-phosphate diphosphorylase